MAMPIIYRILQFAGFAVAFLTNSALFYLLITKNKDYYGRYKFLLTSFCIFSVSYSIVTWLSQPLMLADENGFMMIADNFFTHIKFLGMSVISIFTAFCIMCPGLLTNQFIYRYICLCYPSKLKIYQGPYIIITFLPTILIALTWMAFVFFRFGPSPTTREYFRNSLMETYNENVDDVSYISALYQVPKGAATQTSLSLIDVTGSIYITIYTLICGLIMCFCVSRIVRKMSDHETVMSDKVRASNKQLLTVLILQGLLPFIAMYFPMGISIALPTLGVSIGEVANSLVAYMTFYPALNPLVAIFMIDDFRKRVLRRTPTAVSSINSANAPPVKSNSLFQ